jgi:pimeloyl-ACP methyl ester carboxylesterase
MLSTDFAFPVGYHKLHRIQIMNFQLNRWHSYGYWSMDDIREAARRIDTLEDWKPEMLRQAEKAEANGRMTAATFFYRSAEFFALPSDPDKLTSYAKFQEMFYRHVFDPQRAERVHVPYEGGYLPAFRVRTKTGRRSAGTFVIHGGFDSFHEEFYSQALWLSDRGFDVIVFDGPGQGGARRTYGFTFTHEWEKPAKAVLDHFDVNEVTWLGISLGGWLCFRAAAFEPRISRVIASSVAIIPPLISRFVSALLRFPKLMDGISYLQARVSPQERWSLHNLMFIFDVETPTEGAAGMLALDLQNQHPERVHQKVLILIGEKDLFFPPIMRSWMPRTQVKALNNARSVTERVFTADEHAANHCQIGNVGLALREMVDWISSREPRQMRV